MILGASSSAIGICDQIVAAIIAQHGTRRSQAILWLVDGRGLVHTGRVKSEPFKQK